ncbi:unnamed protein product [Rhizoctonia solani]|uniref:CHAT domain-containing protein n=1 Tax=Rhizoctonia solani TaxID=456999 RepID=A0A8H3DDS3_9AGAM|nr:unnamed protein product [Rhizoctonia solani]
MNPAAGEDCTTEALKLSVGVLKTKFEDTGEIAYLDLAITTMAKAADSKLNNTSDISITLLWELGSAFIDRIPRREDTKDIDLALECHARIISAQPDTPASILIPVGLALVGSGFMDRSLSNENPLHMDLAIECFSGSLLAIQEGDPNVPILLHNLSFICMRQFQLLGLQKDVDMAIHCIDRLISDYSETDEKLSVRLNDLATGYSGRYERFGREEDMKKAIDYRSRAVEISPENSRYLPQYLSNLGFSYGELFQRHGRVADIDKAIEYRSRSALISHNNNPDRPDILGNLGISYSLRFQHLGQKSDIDDSIKYLTQAVTQTHTRHQHLPTWLNGLGSSYMLRFERFGQVTDIDKAVENHVQAVELTPAGHPSLPSRCGNLGISHRMRFELVGQLADLEKSIECQERALLLMPQTHRDFPSQLSSLGGSYMRLFEHSNRVADIEKSIELQARAVSMTPNNHPQLAFWLNNLALSQHARYKIQGDPDSFLASLQYNRQCAQCTTGHTPTRFRAALHWAKLSSFLKLPEALQGYQTAFGLIPQLVWLGTALSRRYEDVQEVGSMAVEAAAAAISAGEHEMALEWLEQGRSVVWTQTLQLRTPLDTLCVAHPVLGHELQQAAKDLHGITSDISPIKTTSAHDAGISMEEVTQKTHKLAERYQELVQDARQLPGFEDFFSPKRISQLIPAARDGPIVVINLHSSRCDALALVPGLHNILHVPLPTLSVERADKAYKQMNLELQLLGIRNRGEHRRPVQSRQDDDNNDNAFTLLLGELWADVAQPVLRELGLLQPPTTNELPHVTWCTTGVMSFLPLHAAGLYERPLSKVSDFVVSSYTPTLGALLSKEVQQQTAHSRILLAGQEATPGLSYLPGTKQELDLVTGQVQNVFACTRIEGEHATTEAVLEAMAQNDWMHMACHAHQCVQDPSQSGFFLQNGTLTLADITQRAFTNKGLAFLSACQTATGDPSIPEESVHLASGLLTAGYSSIIATMWSVNDSDAPLVADKVYQDLLKDGTPDHLAAARALHLAVARLRASIGYKNFGRWVPFIHIGS